jgi:glyoxylase-like metal-dependent hydrolase (beta-lactamase superfamily II)
MKVVFYSEPEIESKLKYLDDLSKEKMKEIKRLGYKPSNVAHIILTHHHSDHAGSLAELKNVTGGQGHDPIPPMPRT